MNAGKLTIAKQVDRRVKSRFSISREMRYKLLRDGSIIGSGNGQTINMSSGGVLFASDRNIEPETYVELSISWPVLLDNNCPMRLIVFGRLVHSADGRCACTIDKYEFRTQARALQTTVTVRNDSMLLKWAEGLRKEGNVKMLRMMRGATA
jgi:hypothetical protein